MGPQEEIKTYRPLCSPETEIWSVRNSNRHFKVFHETYTVCSLVKMPNGSTHWNYRRNKFTSSSHNLMMMEPGEIHATEKAVGFADYFVLFMPPAQIQSFARENGFLGTPHLKIPSSNEGRLVGLFEKFHESVEDGDNPLRSESLLTAGLGYWFKTCMEFPLKELERDCRSALRRPVEYIQAHWDENLSLRALADLAGLSRFHFLRQFSQAFGLPPHAYQTRVRVAKARELLKKGVPVSDMELGFTDQSHFIRHFKRDMGLTPGQYARMVRRPMVSV